LNTETRVTHTSRGKRYRENLKECSETKPAQTEKGIPCQKRRAQNGYGFKGLSPKKIWPTGEIVGLAVFNAPSVIAPFSAPTERKLVLKNFAMIKIKKKQQTFELQVRL
jgi:hypothetical protein